MMRGISRDSQDVLDRFRFDEDGDGMELGQLESLDGISRNIQDAVFTLKMRQDSQ